MTGTVIAHQSYVYSVYLPATSLSYKYIYLHPKLSIPRHGTSETQLLCYLVW